jgi:hypothetical protein
MIPLPHLLSSLPILDLYLDVNLFRISSLQATTLSSPENIESQGALDMITVVQHVGGSAGEESGVLLFSIVLFAPYCSTVLLTDFLPTPL